MKTENRKKNHGDAELKNGFYKQGYFFKTIFFVNVRILIKRYLYGIFFFFCILIIYHYIKIVVK